MHLHVSEANRTKVFQDHKNDNEPDSQNQTIITSEQPG